jgi:4,5:9,10-diseco-3-hydroxy-5,9,17-trioxoandrosta-1(10),2-diene-4-oate hydrolase
MTGPEYEDKYVDVGGINTRFWTAGDEGKTLILIHGAFSSVEFWLANIPVLAENHRVYALDMPGFGLTDKISFHSFPEGARFINEFMKTQNIDRASLIGHSMGGGLSLQYIYQFPDKVERLVLDNSLGLGRKMHIIFKLLATPVIGELVSRPSRNGSKRTLTTAVYDQSVVTDEMVELLYRFSKIPGTQKAFLSLIRGGMNSFVVPSEFIRSFTDNLHTITAPTLIIWGEQDPILPLEHAYVALKQIPDARLEVFERCGHLPHVECPDKFNSCVTEFLAR